MKLRVARTAVIPAVSLASTIQCRRGAHLVPSTQNLTSCLHVHEFSHTHPMRGGEGGCRFGLLPDYASNTLPFTPHRRARSALNVLERCAIGLKCKHPFPSCGESIFTQAQVLADRLAGNHGWRKVAAVAVSAVTSLCAHGVAAVRIEWRRFGRMCSVR